METSTAIITMIMYGAVCFVAGFYVCSQIGDWIDKQIKKK